MVLFVKCLAWFVSALPKSWALAVGRGLGGFVFYCVRYRRAEAGEAMARSIPELSKKEIRDILKHMYQNLGMNLVESLRLSHMSDEFIDEHVNFVNREVGEKALERGKGLLVLTAHIGNWEMLCTLIPKLGYPLAVVAKAIKHKGLDAYIAKTRSQFGLRIFPSHNSYRDCLKTIRNKEVLGFILDQNMTRSDGVFVDFFGQEACTTSGLAVLAAQTGAPVLPVFSVRKPNGYHDITVLPVIEPPPDREQETIIRATQEYTRIIEDFIRKHPDQWIWIHRRWRTKKLPEEPAAE